LIEHEIQGRSLLLGLGPAPELQVLGRQGERIEAQGQAGLAGGRKQVALGGGAGQALGCGCKQRALVARHSLLPLQQLVLEQRQGVPSTTAQARVVAE
jgi:hypothetical protein